MTQSLKSLVLSADNNRTGTPYIELKQGGGCIHVNVYESENDSTYINFQMHDATFRQWAKAFQLFSEAA